jgi:membrane-bound lytic murein transglycosylase D
MNKSESEKMRKKQIFVPFLILASLIIMAASTGSSGCASGSELRKDTFQLVISPPIPEKLEFAGESVPIQNFDVKENLDRDLMVNSYFHSQTLRYLKLANRYFNIIEPILKQDTVPADFKFLALAESGFDPKIVSPAGASGIWQFLKQTGKDYKLEINDEVDERFNIEKSTHAACLYLKESYKKYGNWTMVAASYNVGRNAIDTQIEKQRENNYYNLFLNDETSRYLFRILALKVIIESPEKYGFFVSESEKYPIIPVKMVEVKGTIMDLVFFAKTQGINYKILKLLNPWLRNSSLKNPLGKSYLIKIPQGDFREY